MDHRKMEWMKTMDDDSSLFRANELADDFWIGFAWHGIHGTNDFVFRKQVGQMKVQLGAILSTRGQTALRVPNSALKYWSSIGSCLNITWSHRWWWPSLMELRIRVGHRWLFNIDIRSGWWVKWYIGIFHGCWGVSWNRHVPWNGWRWSGEVLWRCRFWLLLSKSMMNSRIISRIDGELSR